MQKLGTDLEGLQVLELPHPEDCEVGEIVALENPEIGAVREGQVLQVTEGVVAERR